MYEKYFVFIKAILISLMCFRFLRGSGYLFASFPKIGICADKFALTRIIHIRHINIISIHYNQ